MSHADSRTRRYTVVAHRNTVEVTLDIRRSEFIGMVRRVESEDEARAWIDQVRGVHHAATHVVPAFVLGPDRDIQRSSDDGEPAGTAGMPMLQALTNYRAVHDGVEHADISDVCAIAVRYFGGVKLGAGVAQLLDHTEQRRRAEGALRVIDRQQHAAPLRGSGAGEDLEIGRASCRERV